jgi:hypothetical protein
MVSTMASASRLNTSRLRSAPTPTPRSGRARAPFSLPAVSIRIRSDQISFSGGRVLLQLHRSPETWTLWVLLLGLLPLDKISPLRVRWCIHFRTSKQNRSICLHLRLRVQTKQAPEAPVWRGGAVILAACVCALAPPVAINVQAVCVGVYIQQSFVKPYAQICFTVPMAARVLLSHTGPNKVESRPVSLPIPHSACCHLARGLLLAPVTIF